MDGMHGWVQANSDTRHNHELHTEGSAYRQLKHRALGSLTALIVLLVVIVAVSWLSG